jgi:hypothetical protein
LRAIERDLRSVFALTVFEGNYVTTDETLRATLHVIATMQIDILWVLQSGTMNGSDAQRLLQQLNALQREVRLIREAAAASPEQYAHYSAPGQTANKPSDN